MDAPVLIAALCLLYLKTACGQCGYGWIQRVGSCYHISHDKQEWIHAADICTLDGGYLVEVNDADEGHFLASQVQQLNFPEGQAWMGATDNMIKGDWVWTHSNTLLSSSYSHWSSWNPDDFGGNENCLSIFTSGFWNDFPCDQALHYICEKDIVHGSLVG